MQIVIAKTHSGATQFSIDQIMTIGAALMEAGMADDLRVNSFC